MHMKTIITTTRTAERRGSALVMMTIATTALAGLSAALFTIGMGSAREQRSEMEETHARYVCQAGLSQAYYQLQRGEPGTVGTVAEPVAWGRAEYWVDQQVLVPGILSLRASGRDDRAAASMELVVREVPNTMWRYGAFGREFMHMDSNSRVDSYDSTLGTYASQALNGSGSSAYALTNGDVGSNGDVHLDQNATVYGDAVAGPSHTTTVLGNAVVFGSTSPTSAPMDMPAISVPTYTSLGNLTVASDSSLGTGNSAYGSVQVNANKTLTINGPANFVIGNLRLRSGSRIVINATNGPVTFYVLDNFVINSNAQIYSTDYQPQNVTINLLSDNVINPEVDVDLDDVDFDSNSKIYGTIYAPTAAIEVNSNFELFGSMIARSVDLDSNSRVHFDEALITATASATPLYETICWRDVPVQD